MCDQTKKSARAGPGRNREELFVNAAIIYLMTTQAQPGMNQGYHRFPCWNLLIRNSEK
jgi:hypothetical protein